MSNLGFALHSRIGLSLISQPLLPQSTFDPPGLVMVSTRLPVLSAASQFDFSPYWSVLLEAQDFFGFTVPDVESLEDTLRSFSLETTKRLGAIDVCATVTLTREGEIIITGRSITVWGNAPVKLSKIDQNDSIFPADQKWQKYAVVTNSKAQSDALARHFNAAGYADAVELDDSGALGRTVLGSLVMHSDVGTLFLASVGSPIPQFVPLARAGVFSEARDAISGTGMDLLSLGDVSRCWWVSPDFEVHPATLVFDASTDQVPA